MFDTIRIVANYPELECGGSFSAVKWDASTNTVSLTSTKPVGWKQLHKYQNSTKSSALRDARIGENCNSMQFCGQDLAWRGSARITIPRPTLEFFTFTIKRCGRRMTKLIRLITIIWIVFPHVTSHESDDKSEYHSNPQQCENRSEMHITLSLSFYDHKILSLFMMPLCFQMTNTEIIFVGIRVIFISSNNCPMWMTRPFHLTCFLRGFRFGSFIERW